MTSQTIPVENGQSLRIRRTGGDLVIQGWDRSEAEVRGDGIQIEQGQGLLRISSTGDLVLSIPRSLRVEISIVKGDARLEHLDGAIELSVIGGDAILRNLTGPVVVKGPVGGETRLENVAQISVAGGRSRHGHSSSTHWRRGAEPSQLGEDPQRRRAEVRLQNAERKLSRLRPGIGAHFGHWLGSRRAAAVFPDGHQEPVSDEERMAILTMLQDKKITSAQADTLLTALEGGQEGASAGGSAPEEAGS